MDHATKLLLLCALVLASTFPASEAQKPQPSNYIRMTFYEHNFVYGPNVSSVSTGILGTGPNPLVAGTISIYNNKVTTGPNITSTLLGYSKGAQLVTNILPQSENIQVYVINLQYGSKKGVLSLLGYINNQAGGAVQPIPIVGGTGDFLFTTGVANISPSSFNAQTGELVYKYQILLKKI